MTTICFNYIHVLHKKAAFIPDASIGVLRHNSITKTKKKQRLVYVHIAEYCIERLAGLVDIVAVSYKETT